MIASSQEAGARGGLDTTRLLSIVNRPSGPERTRDVLMDFTSSKNYVEIARRLNREDAAKLVDVLDQVCRAGLRDTHPLDDDRDDQVIGPIDRKKTQNTTLLKALGSICSATTQLPHTTILSDGVERCGDIAVASGGFTDTWRGWYRTKNVALKAFRTYPIQDLREAEKVHYTALVNVALIFDDPHRSYGRR